MSAKQHQSPPDAKRSRSKSPEKDDHHTKKLTNEEIEKATQRLVQRPPPPELKDPIQLSPRIVKEKEQIDKAVERLYTVAVEQKKRKLQESETALHGADVPKTVHRTHEEIEDGVNRLYTQSLESLKHSLDKSIDRYRHKPPTHSPRLSVEEQTKRLYTESLQKKKETQDELYAKYIAATAVKGRKMTGDELKASADRLSSKK